MLKKEAIKAIIRKQIEKDERLGDQVGGSGHSSFVSYTIKDYETKPLENNALKIKYSYEVTVETEFTYYPDNPPQVYKHEKTIVVDRTGLIDSE